MTGKWKWDYISPPLEDFYNLLTDEDREQLHNGVIPLRIVPAVQKIMEESYTKEHGTPDNNIDRFYKSFCMAHCWEAFRRTLFALATSSSSPS